MAELVC